MPKNITDLNKYKYIGLIAYKTQHSRHVNPPQINRFKDTPIKTL